MARTSKNVFISPGKDYFHTNIKYLFLVGLWPKSDFNNFQSKCYKVYQTALHILSVTYLVITSIGSYNCRNDTEVLIANLDKSLVGLNFASRVFSVVITRNDLDLLIDEIMHSGDKITDECNKKMSKLLYVVTGLVVFTVTSFSISALYEGVMTVEAWMPFDPMKSRINLLLAAQILAGTYLIPCALRGTGIQGLICSVMMYFCEQLEQLQGRLRSLNYSPQFDEGFRQEFKDIIKTHVRLIRYCKSMDDAFQLYFFVHNFGIIIEMCLSALMVTVVGIHEKKMLLNFGIFLFISLLNTYIFCYLGNEMITKSEGLAKAAYEAPWTSWPLDLQRDLLTVVTVAQRPLTMSAGRISIISLNTYAQILYNGYSVFTMLHDVM